MFAAGGKTIGGGVWFGKADAHSEFVVAEGVESTLSGMRLSHVEAGVAALSELGVRRLVLPDEARKVRVWADHDVAGQGLAPPAKPLVAGRSRVAKSPCRSRQSLDLTQTIFGAGGRSEGDFND